MTLSMVRARLALTGFLAGAICVLSLFQGLWTACALAGLRFDPYPAGGVPLILKMAAIGGALGTIFALVAGRSARVAWRNGLTLGLLVSLAVWFGVAPLAGAPIAAGWRVLAMAQTLTVFLIWGAFLGLSVAWLTGSRES